MFRTIENVDGLGVDHPLQNTVVIVVDTEKITEKETGKTPMSPWTHFSPKACGAAFKVNLKPTVNDNEPHLEGT